MRKVLLSLAMILSASGANAAGLYISAGYGQANPDLKATSTTSATAECLNTDGSWNSSCVYGELEKLPGFPNGSVLADYNSSTKVGYQAADWDAGLVEKYDYNTKSSKTMAFAIGWDISQNPFRFEFEYQRTKFKSPDYRLTINDPEGNYYEGMYQDDATSGYTQCVNGICLNDAQLNLTEDAVSTSTYDFDVSFYKDLDATVDSLMANVYFEIPGFGSIDPYVGYGYGKSKINWDLVDGDGLTFSGGSDGYVNAQQFIAGVEYRFEESPIIAGIEYRQFKTDFDERDEKDPYSFKHKYVMFKLRYDFISDEF
ncbi:MAG: porin family protein [bacterium]|nr:porin family protein [bacterium]